MFGQEAARTLSCGRLRVTRNAHRDSLVNRDDLANSVWLFFLIVLQDSLVNWLPSPKALFHAMPILNLFFAGLPAEEHNLVLYDARKVEEPDIEIFDLYSNRLNLGHSVLGFLKGFVDFGLASGSLGHVHQKATA